MEFIEKYPDKPWNWNRISTNPNITMEFIEKYPDKPWNWNWIPENPNITMEFIEKYPDKPWDWDYISMNPNINMDIIEKYPDKPWSWCYISRNKFLKEKNLFTEKQMRKYLAAYRIQQYWDKALTNPSCTIGRNKINRNYDELFNEDGSMKFNRDF
jgi:hypothetical protein